MPLISVYKVFFSDEFTLYVFIRLFLYSVAFYILPLPDF